MKTTFRAYRFEILRDGKVTPDTMRAIGRDEADARAKASQDPDLNSSETIGKLIGGSDESKRK